MSASEGDLILIVADEWSTTCEVLGTLRNDLGRPPVHEGPYRYVWIVEFPLFVGVDPVTGTLAQGTIRLLALTQMTLTALNLTRCLCVRLPTTLS